MGISTRIGSIYARIGNQLKHLDEGKLPYADFGENASWWWISTENPFASILDTFLKAY